MKLNKSLLTLLLNSPGVSGREDVVSNIIKEHIKQNGLKLDYDNLGSIWGIKKSSNPKAKTLLIDSHMDEVGFIVTNINKRGFLSFEAIGGVWNKSLNSQRLRVWNSKYSNSYSGVVLWPESNSHQQKGVTPKIEDMLLDIGAKDEKEINFFGIEKGSMITFDSKAKFNGERVISKAVDNRVGVTMVIQIMQFIKDKNFDYNIVLGASVQEEIGLIGARISSYKIEPDLAMVIDVSPATDYPDENEPKGILGNGTMIRFKDARTIYPNKVIKYLRNIIKKEKIKSQNYFSEGGTNAGNIHLSKNGVRTIPIGIVARNLHTNSAVFDINDYNETLKLIESILIDLNSNKIVKFN